MLCCKPAITFTLIAHVCSICTPPITLSQKHSETYDTCTSGRKVFPQSARPPRFADNVPAARLHRAPLISTGGRLTWLGRARCHVTYAPPRTYTALPLRQSSRNAAHQRVHSARNRLFCLSLLFNVSSCPIYMISVFVAKPRVAASLQRRIMMRRARAPGWRTTRDEERFRSFCFLFFHSRRRRRRRQRPVRVGGMEGGRDAPLTWGD